MIKISGIVIAKNAEELIADCLDSLSFCDEIVVVDNKSEDRTRDIAEKMGAHIFECSSEDFAEIRSFGLKRARGEWILYVDTDERVTEELRKNIKSAINIKDNSLYVYKLIRKNFYFGNHEWPYKESLQRLFRKDKLERWYGKLHESPKIKGQVGEINGYLLHYTHRNLALMVDKTIRWSKVEAELRYSKDHPRMTWWRFPRVMLKAFFDSYIRQGGWKIGTIGLIESIYQSFSIFVTYARLWEMQQNKKYEKTPSQ